MSRHRLSPHFTIEEFDCHDGTKVSKRDHDGLEYLCKVFLEPLRSKYGPVKICSGFRTEAYNRRVGGVSNSYHRYDIHDGNDQASDIVCAQGNPAAWHRTLNTIRQTKRSGKGGLGLYPTFVHVDLRDYAANWKG